MARADAVPEDTVPKDAVPEDATPERVVLVLSGGGAKTAAHLGAWRAFAEAGFRPQHIVAASMGAVVAAGLAAGVKPDELLARLVEAGRGSLVLDPEALAAGLAARSLFRADGLRRAIEAVVPVRRFGELAIPLTVPVVDLDTGEVLLYGAAGKDAPLVDVLAATCALPVYFPPVALDGRRCADGGLGGVLPLEPAAALHADLVLAVDVGSGVERRGTSTGAGIGIGIGTDAGAAGSDAGVAQGPPVPDPALAGVPPLLRAHDESTGVLLAALTAAQLARWHIDPSRSPLVYVRPPIERYATFRIDRLEHYAAAGYGAAREALDSAV
jgi:predicted acylesterase/phospholipase RssA